jgi:hypothetical protein
LLFVIRTPKGNSDLLDIVTWIGYSRYGYHKSKLYLFSLNSVLFTATKYSHAAVWSPELRDTVGKRHYPLMAMVATLVKPTPD